MESNICITFLLISTKIQTRASNKEANYALTGSNHARSNFNKRCTIEETTSSQPSPQHSAPERQARHLQGKEDDDTANQGSLVIEKIDGWLTNG